MLGQVSGHTSPSSVLHIPNSVTVSEVNTKSSFFELPIETWLRGAGTATDELGQLKLKELWLDNERCARKGEEKERRGGGNCR